MDVFSVTAVLLGTICVSSYLDLQWKASLSIAQNMKPVRAAAVTKIIIYVGAVVYVNLIILIVVVLKVMWNGWYLI